MPTQKLAYCDLVVGQVTAGCVQVPLAAWNVGPVIA
jgi:hypothetical protein